MTEVKGRNENGLSRRTMVKGAAWSVPVIAVAAATPMASASTADQFDVQVTGTCEGDFRAAGLASNILNALTGVLGLDPATRSFTVTAAEGTIPAGTQFTLTDGGLVNVNALSVTGAIGLDALNIIRVGNTATITLEQDLAEGQSCALELLGALADIRVASDMTLALAGTDNPSTAPGAANSAEVSTTLGTSVNVLGIVDVALQVCG